MNIETLVAQVPALIDTALICAMQAGMDYGDAQQIRWAMLDRRAVAWGADSYGGASCPLRAAGFKRSRRFSRHWDVEGGDAFQAAFDRLMDRYVLPGPGMVGLPKVTPGMVGLPKVTP